MPCTVAILAAAHLVRQPIATALAPLGFVTYEFSELSELVLSVNQVAPQMVVVDIDGLQGKWQALATALQGGQRRVALVLLAGRLGFEEAHEALALGVAGIILKPFLKAEHTARLSELCLKARGLRPRRSEPRFTLPGDAPLFLLHSGPRGEERYETADVSKAGLGIRLPAAGAEAGTEPAGSLLLGALTLAEAKVRLSARVVHRSAERIGLRVLKLQEGKQAWRRQVEAQHARAFGAGGKKRNRW